jgi:hypothetical protein
MHLSGKKRLAIVLSVAWLLFWAWSYFDSAFVSFENKLSGFLLFGLLPVAVPWSAGWVWSGFRGGLGSGRVRTGYRAPPAVDFGGILLIYAHRTAAQNDWHLASAIEMMRDQPGEVARLTGLDEAVVRAWCESDHNPIDVY